MEGGELRELAQILLDDGRVVLQEEPVQILGNEFVQTEEGTLYAQRNSKNPSFGTKFNASKFCTFIAIVQVQKRRSQRVQSLPVNVLRMGRHPSLQQSLQLVMTLRGGQQLVVLMTARDVHLDLTIRRRGGLLVDASVASVLQDSEHTRPDVATQQRRNVGLRFGDDQVARERIALEQPMEQDDTMELVFGVAFANDDRQALHVGGVVVVVVG